MIVTVFIGLAVLAVVGAFISAIFVSTQSGYLAIIWFCVSLLQAAFFAAIASALNYLHEIAANTKVLADARLEEVQSKNTDTSM